MRIKLYLDEDVPYAFAQALSNRGVDVITTQQVGNDTLSDEEQLEYALRINRTIFTHNKKDFIILNNKKLRENKEHSGIILSDQLPIGTLLRRFMKLWFFVKAEEMRNRLEFLSNWK
jgi:hypothetical protein